VAVLQQYRAAFGLLAIAFLGVSFYLTFIRVRSHWINRLLWGMSVIITAGILWYLH